MTGKPLANAPTPRRFGAGRQGAGRRWLPWPRRSGRLGQGGKEARQPAAPGQGGSPHSNGDAPPDASFSGSLADLDVLNLLRFLGGLGKSGRVALESGGWTGEIWLDQGEVVAAFRGAERGLDALDGILLAFGRGSFAFHEREDVPSDHDAHALALADVEARVDQTATDGLAAVVGDATTVPRVRSHAEDHAAGAQQGWDRPAPPGLDPPTLRLFLAVDGAITVKQLAERFGLARTARGLVKLAALGLVDVGNVDGVNGADSADRIGDSGAVDGAGEAPPPSPPG